MFAGIITSPFGLIVKPGIIVGVKTEIVTNVGSVIGVLYNVSGPKSLSAKTFPIIPPFGNSTDILSSNAFIQRVPLLL